MPKSNFKFIKCVSVFFVLAFVLFSHNVSLAQERTGETLTKIEIKDVKIEKSDTEIKISGVLLNPSKNVITPEITHLLILKTINPLIKARNDIDLLPSLIVSADEGKDYFSLKPNEQKTFSYVLPFSPYIPQTNYSLYLGFIRSNGQVETRYESTIKNLGSFMKEGFLAFNQENCVLLNKDGKEFNNNDGPTFLPGESPKTRCLVKNIGDKEIGVWPKILWKEVYVYGKPLDGTMAMENPDELIVFKPGETKLVSLSMPEAEKPQVYQSLVSFEDEDGESRSFNMFFRWTIAGESARIKNVAQISQPKVSYAKGEKIDLSVDYFGSADLFWTGAGQKVSNLNNLIMKTVIKDGDGNICGEKEEILADIADAGEKNKAVGVTLDKKCKNMSYSVFLSSNQKSLAEESGELPKVIKEKTIANYLYFGIPALMILLAFAFFRKRKIVPVHILIILFANVIMFFGITLAATQTYPDWGGTTSTYKWGGDWTLNNGTEKLKSNPAGGGGLNNLSVFSAEANFNGYFDGSGDLNDIYIDYRAVDNSCENTGMRVQFEMFIKADGLSEQSVRFAKKDTSDWKNKIRLWYNNASGDIIERRFNINSSDIGAFYNTNKVAKSNPKLVIYVKQVGYNSHENKYSEGYLSIASNKLRTENDAFNMSDSIKIEIPLKLPAPSADLSLASISGTSPIAYNCKPTLSWTVNDVSSCEAEKGWSGILDASNGTHSRTMLQGITKSTDYGLSCKKNLGSAIGEGTYTDSVTVEVKDAPTVDLKADKWGDSTVSFSDSLTINSGDAVTFHWGINNWSYSSAGVQSCEFEFENVDYDFGTQKTISNITSTKTYNITCKNSCSDGTSGYTATDSVKIEVIPKPGTKSSSSSSSSDGTPSQPNSFTASAACKAVNLIWDIDSNGEYNDPVGNTGSKVVEYYEITRDGSYTVKKSDNINKWDNTSEKFVDDNNSYTDYSATDTGKEYSYTIKACNDQDKCSAEAGPAKATPKAGPCTVNPTSSTPTSSTPASSSSSADPDWYNLTFKTSGSGSGNATRYVYDDTWGWSQSKPTPVMSNEDTADIGRDYKFKLVPNPSSGSYFSSWSGCGSVNSDNECLLEKNPYPGADKTVTATFNDNTGGCVGCGSSVKAYISARDTVVTDGNSTVVTWTSDNADSCEQKEGGSDTGWIDASDTASGSYTTANFTTSGGSRTYTIECAKGSQKSGDVSVTVDVGSGYTGSPSVTMWADPQSIGYKKTSAIQWLGSNIQGNCLLYSASDNMNGYLIYYNFPSSQYFGPGYYAQVGSNNSTGQKTGKLYGDTTYKIQCNGYGPSYTKVTAQTTITVAKPVSNFTLTNPAGASLVATIVEGLSANSNSIDLALRGEAIGNVSLSASVPAISGAKAQFSSDDGAAWSDTLSADISAISQVKIKVIKIPGATPVGTYNTAITATDTGTGGKTKKLNVNLRVDRVSSEWEEF